MRGKIIYSPTKQSKSPVIVRPIKMYDQRNGILNLVSVAWV